MLLNVAVLAINAHNICRKGDWKKKTFRISIRVYRREVLIKLRWTNYNRLVKILLRRRMDLVFK